jgi:DNA-binding GntR family transcriptional regulator
MPPWPGRTRPQLADEVVQYVRALIMAGEVEQGSFMRLDRLAKDMGISATPVREAMAALEREGFVRLEPRRGYIVSRFSRRDIEDLFMVEAFVASELAARAAARMSDERLGELYRVYADLERFIASAEYEQADAANFRLYWLVHDAARSPKLSWLVGTIVPYSPLGYTSNAKLRATILDGHGAVLKALSSRDSDEARLAMDKYVLAMGGHVIDQYEQTGLWSRSESAEDPDVLETPIVDPVS